MKKKLIAKLLSSFMIVSFLVVNGGIQPQIANAAVESGQNFNYSYTANNISWNYEVDTQNNAINVAPSNISDINGSIIIPDYLDGKKVISIKDSAFKDCTGLTNITFPEGLKSIGNDAFRGCIKLENFVIPESVTSIGYFAFYNCDNLSSVHIPKALINIGGVAFYNCKNLKEIIVDQNNANYQSVDGVLYNKQKTELINYPTQKAGNSYIIPDSVTKISKAAFFGCKNLTSISIPKGITAIEGNTFANCTSLSKISIPDGVTYIGIGAFLGCSNLKGIVIPQKVTTIDIGAFYACSSLKYISVPDSVTDISLTAFDGCINMDTIFTNNGSYASKYNWKAGKADTEIGYVSQTMLNQIKTKLNYLLQESDKALEAYITSGGSATDNTYIKLKYAVTIFSAKLNSRDFDIYEFGSCVSQLKNMIIDIKKQILNIPVTKFSTNVPSPQAVGTAIELTNETKVLGYTGIAQTRYDIYDGSSWKVLKDFSTQEKAQWTPSKAGTYKILVTVKDVTGRVLVNSYNYIINDALVIDNINVNPDSPQLVGANITVNSTSSGGVGTLLTKYMISDGTTEEVIKDYSAEKSFVWQPKKAGVYNITAIVKDETGKEVKKSLTYEIYKPLSIDSVQIDPGTSIKLGNTVSIRSLVSGGNGKVTYSINAKCNEITENILEASQDINTAWTPKKSGIWTITVTATDESGNKTEKQALLEVREAAKNQTTIYYKGFSTPYFHYKIGNGNWTTVPGIAMTATTEKAGYTHKVTVDLGDADNITACFNNGSGRWDSRNGANYFFNAGTYEYSNGKITQIEAPDKTLLINSFKSSVEGRVKVGNSVTLTANATTTKSNLKYKISVVDSKNETTVLSDYSTNNIPKWTPTVAGDYKLVLDVTDSSGRIIEREMRIKAYDISSNNTTIYYKGYSAPYIHYKIGNGQWTQVPGIKMIPTTEKPGFTHKIVVNLGDADTLTACFNNGYGNWDSRNGANYAFKAGTYTYTNGNSVLVDQN